MRISLSSSGENLYRILVKRVLIKTDFPDPVVPATSKWGVLLKSITSIFPDMSFPMHMGILCSQLT